MNKTLLKNIVLAICLAGISYIFIDSIRPEYRTERIFQGFRKDENDLKLVFEGSNGYYKPKEKPVYKNFRIREFNFFAGAMGILVLTIGLILRPIKG